MRLTCFCIVFALATGFFTDRTLAQIPERITFQPGSFAYGYRPGVAVSGVATAAPIAAVIETEADDDADEADDADDEPKTEWEDTFGEKPEKPEPIEATPAQAPGLAWSTAPNSKPPYLAWHRSPLTGRIHLVPYQPGYTEAPEQFPTHQSHLNLWLSTLPSREQSRPQQKYLGYYDPTPEILTDKPSRLQLLLGYGDPNWTTSCCNSPQRARMAHCLGVDPICFGPFAEARISDQGVTSGPLNGRSFTPAPYVGTMYANPRGAFGFRRGLMPQQYPGAEYMQQCPCPECMQQCPCPECVQQRSCPECRQQCPCPECVQQRSCPECVQQRPCPECRQQRSCPECVQQRPCPECAQQRSCPECRPQRQCSECRQRESFSECRQQGPLSSRLKQKAACEEEKPACGDTTPCDDCACKKPCPSQKAARVLNKNAPKKK